MTTEPDGKPRITQTDNSVWADRSALKMRSKRNSKIVIGCSIVAAICFGIVSYGSFYRGWIELGWTFALLTVAQLGLAVMNYMILKKIK